MIIALTVNYFLCSPLSCHAIQYLSLTGYCPLLALTPVITCINRKNNIFVMLLWKPTHQEMCTGLKFIFGCLQKPLNSIAVPSISVVKAGTCYTQNLISKNNLSSPSSSKLLISTFTIQLPFQYTCELFLLLPESKSCLVCDIPLCLTNNTLCSQKIQLRDKKMLQVITGIFRHY